MRRSSKQDNYSNCSNQNNSQDRVISGFSSLTVFLHLSSLLLVYAYIKQQFTFSFIYTLSPSMLVFLAEGYQIVTTTKGVERAKYLISFSLLVVFLLVLGKVVKDEGGYQDTNEDKDKWLVRHRKCFELLALAMACYVFYDMVNHQKQSPPSVVKSVLLSILSSLSTPLSVCSGGACNSIYISTITSILSSFSVPLTLAVPLLNFLGYVLQLIGLVSLYSANKWRSVAFWIYLISVSVQLINRVAGGNNINGNDVNADKLSESQQQGGYNWVNWACCGGMIIATVINAKTNQFFFGKNNKAMFKQSIV